MPASDQSDEKYYSYVAYRSVKGVILAGGTGSRLHELTRVVNKHLLPIYDKPMIYFPINTLHEAGIDSIMIVTDKRKAGDFLRLLGSGEKFGVRFTYGLQDNAAGIADALIKARDFVGDDVMTVILGDNLVFGPANWLRKDLNSGCRIFLKEVDEPNRFGIATLNDDGKIKNIVEKPASTSSRLAVIGVYQFRSDVFDVISTIKPSDRKELEITDVNRHYLAKDELEYSIISNDWIDAGTVESLYKAQGMAREYSRGEKTV